MEGTTGGSRWPRQAMVGTVMLGVILGGRKTASAQAGEGFRVVRSADRRGVIVLLGSTIAAPGTPVDVRRFVLLDRTDRRLVPLDALSDTSARGCPRATALPEDRVCVRLATTAAALVDAHAYVLMLDSIPIVGSKGRVRSVGAGVLLPIEPVAARLLPPGGSPVRVVEIAYDIDVSHDTTLAVTLAIDHRSVEVRTPANIHPGRPLCYARGSLSFKCLIDVPVHEGDSITAAFARTPGSTEPLPAVPIAPAVDTESDAVGLATKDTSLYSISLAGGLSQTAGTQTATLQALWRNMPVALMTSTLWGRGWTYEGSLSPYLNLLLTTDRATTGYIEPGLQYSGFWSAGGKEFVQQVVALVTPRGEADAGTHVVNFVPLDVDVRVGLRGLAAGPLPFGGAYAVWPHAGVELGWTVKGTDVARPESNDPARLKAGIAASARWPSGDSQSWLCRTLGCGGVDLGVNWQHYTLLRTPAGEPSAQENYVTASATYKFTHHVGLSLSVCNGNPPPLFTYHQVLSIGAAVVY